MDTAAGPGTGQDADPGLRRDMLDPDPVAQFTRWLADAEAAGLPEPNAMVLATVSAAGQPRGRTVLLKSHDASGFVFYTNRTSRKGSDLAAVARACLTFPWYALKRQTIIEGTVQELSAADSEPYFHSRPRGSQLGAWASRQSTVIGSRDELEKRYAELEQRWAGEPVPMPDFWGGYLVVPDVIEFWQGRMNRLHDRFRYRRDGGAWVIERQAP
ncbi:MAG TPA: pyridoxamine 5'-phosphate oxidase [Streptosporangiaceae bacterium]|jgi:pyridoxamine 5'-phosphate oxidase|nr:pyridoxamine 5'-phosphate oxidase [Streptosporangiaceae bacterium]